MAPGGGEAAQYRPPGPGARRDPDEEVSVSPAVSAGSAPVLRVRVTESGWQFLAGPPDPAEALVRVPRRDVYRAERSLAVLEEFLPVGYGAVREGPTEPWGIGPLALQDAPPEPPPPASPPAPAAPTRRRWWRRGAGH